MVSLEAVSGLPLSLDGVRLVFGDGLTPVEPDVRHLSEFAPVFAPDGELTGPEDVYFMYRGIARPGDEGLFKKHNYRYDITILRPGLVGRERVKTIGHYHPLVSGEDVTYPEVYEVLHGRAHYVCQRAEGHRALEFIIIEANPGDKVVIKPGYGHITINPLEEPLVMSNVTADGFSSDYRPFAKMRGAAYYQVADGEWELNERYEVEHPPRWAAAKEVSEFALLKGRSLYASITSKPEKFDFLVHPQKYKAIFERAIELGGVMDVKW
ncbi:MAG: glucose-6-phosphate isomerase [Actinobacteria bacterium]|nr:glucose-6-phosphate isomerase [Actinomycetota bacterium]